MDLSVNRIASGATGWRDLAPIATTVQQLLPLVLPDFEQGELDGDISLLTHTIITAIKEGPEHGKRADDLLSACCALRVAVALQTGERPSIPYQEDLLTLGKERIRRGQACSDD
jgi:hypothetical protein